MLWGGGARAHLPPPGAARRTQQPQQPQPPQPPPQSPGLVGLRGPTGFPWTQWTHAVRGHARNASAICSGQCAASAATYP